MKVYDHTECLLGEGPLWHPLRQQLFWFDILSKTLFSRKNDTLYQWQFNEYVSAAGWIDENHLIIATETALIKFNIDLDQRINLCDLEADNPTTRSNDGRADPWGGFWIGTMGKQAQSKAGSIYRYYLGELRKVKSDITITNAICFSPDRKYSYHADTVEQKIWRTPLAMNNGWPNGDAALFIDFGPENLNPDGAVCDADGNLWIAQWGASRVVQYSNEGLFLKAIDLPTAHVTCPAFGGENLNTLFITTAQQDLTPRECLAQNAGMTYCISTNAKGLPEPRVNIS